MTSRQAFYAESLAESTTTSTAEQDKCVLTFTPAANSTWWVIASWSHGCDAAGDDHRSLTSLYHVQSDTSFGDGAMRTHELTSPPDWLDHFALGGIDAGSSPVPQTLKIVYRSFASGDTTRIRDARILVLQADADDRMAEATELASTTEQIWQTAVTLGWTPATAGDYLVIAAAQLACDANGAAAVAQLNDVAGGTVYGGKPWFCVDDWDAQPFCAMARRSLAATPQTFRLEWKTGTAAVDAYIANARILALRLDRFANAHVAESVGEPSTTSVTDQDVLTLTRTPQPVEHAALAIGAFNCASTAVSGYAQVAQNENSLSQVVKESQNSAGYQYLGVVSRQVLSAAPTTWAWQMRAELTGTTVNAAGLAIAVLQLGASPTPKRRRYMVLA